MTHLLHGWYLTVISRTLNSGVFLLGDLHGTVLIHGYKEEDKRSIKDGGFFFQFLKIRGKEADEG